MKMKRWLFIIPILFTMLMFRTQTVYATENDQLPTENQTQQQEQKPEEEQGQENPGQGDQSQEQQQAQQEESQQQEETQAEPAPKPASRTGRKSTAATSQSSAESQKAEEKVEEEAGEEEDSDLSAQSGKYILELLSYANIRKEPSISSESLIVAPFGIKLNSDERTTNESGETWYKLTYGGATGYIREDILEVTEERQEEDVSEETGDEENAEEPLDESSDGGEQTQETAIDSLSIPKTVPTTRVEPKGEDTAAASFTSVEEMQLHKSQTKQTLKIDAIFFMFMGLTIIGGLLAFLVFILTRNEYYRIKKSVAKESMD